MKWTNSAGQILINFIRKNKYKLPPILTSPRYPWKRKLEGVKSICNFSCHLQGWTICMWHTAPLLHEAVILVFFFCFFPSLFFYLKIDTLLQHWKSSVSGPAANNFFPRGLPFIILFSECSKFQIKQCIFWLSYLCQVLALCDHPAILDKSETQGLFRYQDKKIN